VVDGAAQPELGYADPLPGPENPDGSHPRKKRKTRETA
jgi:hypothetical protein